MTQHIYTVCVLSVLLAACGGGGGAGVSAPVPEIGDNPDTSGDTPDEIGDNPDTSGDTPDEITYTVAATILDSFGDSNDGGVIKARYDYSDGSEDTWWYFGLGVTIAEQNLENPSSDSDAIDELVEAASGFQLTGSSGFHDIRTGSLAFGGTTVNYTVYEKSDSDASMLWEEWPSFDDGAVSVFVGEWEGMPTGSFDYAGTYTWEAWDLSPTRSDHSVGVMAAEVDFDRGLITTFAAAVNIAPSGAEPFYDAVLGADNVPINTADGTFGTRDAIFGRYEYAEETPYYIYDATIYGGFGGPGAENMGGIWYTTDTRYPDHAGGFLGHKQ